VLAGEAGPEAIVPLKKYDSLLDTAKNAYKEKFEMKGIEKTAEHGGGYAAKKMAMHGLGKVAKKGVPVAGSVYEAVQGGRKTYDYLKHGDMAGAGLQTASVAAGTIPYAGPIASAAIDTFNERRAGKNEEEQKAGREMMGGKTGSEDLMSMVKKGQQIINDNRTININVDFKTADHMTQIARSVVNEPRRS
jgi:hypothetical protein